MPKRANGEGSIYRRPDGWWVAQVDLGWHGGKRRRKYIAARTRAEAHKKLRAALKERDEGLIRATVPTLAAWLAIFLSDVAGPNVRASTYRIYETFIRLHINPALGRIRLDRLQPEDLVALYKQKAADGMAPTSVRYMHAIIRRALAVAVKWRLVGVNVATLVDTPRVPHKEIRPYTVEEARQFLEAVRGDRLEARWSVGVALGLRQGEVLGLGWDTVDLDAGTVRVTRALQRQQHQGLVFAEPKSAQGRRTISVPAPLVQGLREHRSRQLTERLAAGPLWEGSDCVFTTPIGTPIDPRNDHRAFKRVLKDAKLRDVRLHDLRHTAASLLLLQGVQPRVVMEVLGHSQISLTMNTYSHVVPELKQDAADRIGAALWG